VLWVGGTGVVHADSIGIHFESSEGYRLGSIYLQPGSADVKKNWAGTLGAPLDPLIDQEIVNATPYGYPSFGGQSWRMSNAHTSGSFGDWPFSPSLDDEAGETNAQNGGPYSGGTRMNHFEVQWDFASTIKDAEQPGLQISTSPDRGDGARMSFIRMRDNSNPDGLSVEFVDYQDRKPYGSLATPSNGCGTEDSFVLTTVAKGLDRTVPHTVKLTMDFLDGPRNDLVHVFVDGKLVHTGTSWEDYYRWCTESGGGVPNNATADAPRTVDSMIFQARTSGGEAPGTLHNGFLFDNLSYATSNVNQCDNHNAQGDGDVKSSDGHVGHEHFNKHGCGHDDNDSVQHDDDQQGHHFQSTSVDAAQFTTALNGRTAVITGTGTDNSLPVTFTLTAVDYDGLLPAAYTLVLSDGYVFAGTVLDGSTLSVL